LARWNVLQKERDVLCRNVPECQVVSVSVNHVIDLVCVRSCIDQARYAHQRTYKHRCVPSSETKGFDVVDLLKRIVQRCNSEGFDLKHNHVLALACVSLDDALDTSVTKDRLT